MISNVHIDVLNPYLGFVQTKLQGIICSVRYASYPKIFFTFLDPPSQCRHHVTRQRAPHVTQEPDVPTSAGFVPSVPDSVLL